MAMNDEMIAEIVVRNGQWIADSATQLRRSQWASAASAATNEKEQAEYERIAESSRYDLNQNGSSVVLKETDVDESPFQKNVEEGMEPPLSGGHNGIVTNPDGSTEPSRVPRQLWGTPLPEYAKEPNEVSEGVKKMLQTLVPGWVNDAVDDSQEEIAAALKGEISSLLQAALSKE